MRVRKALVVRPRAEAWPAEVCFEVPLIRGDTLPLPLVQLASAVKFGSTHRVALHDDALHGEAERSLGIHRPDGVFIAWHPGARGHARRIAHAARSSARTVFAVVEVPEHASVALTDGPFDGVLLVGDGAGLVGVMNALGKGAAAEELPAAAAAATDLDIIHPDRKLLDYARYQGSLGARWRAAVRAFRPVGDLRGSPRSDKGRFAASAVRLDENLEAVERDIAECVLLGIPWVDLRGHLDVDGYADLLPRLARRRRDTPGIDPDVGGLRLRVSPRDVTKLNTRAGHDAAVVAVDFGTLAPNQVADAVAGVEAARAAGWVATAEVALGAGDDPEREARALQDLEEAGVAVQGRILLALTDEALAEPDALDIALTAHRVGDPRRDALVRLAREVDARADAAARLVRPRRPSVRSFLRRLARRS